MNLSFLFKGHIGEIRQTRYDRIRRNRRARKAALYNGVNKSATKTTAGYEFRTQRFLVVTRSVPYESS